MRCCRLANPLPSPLMKKALLISSLVCCTSFAAICAPLEIISQDDAGQDDYKPGWSSGKNGGNGFGKWNLQTQTGGGEHSHAGFYVASTSDKSDLNGIAEDGKAFGEYANGTAFEAAAAFRPFDRPLRAGQSFSVLMEHGQFVRKWATDSPDPGSCGLTLLKDAGGATSTDDYNKDSRFEFGYLPSEAAYVIYDGDGKKKLDIPFTDAGLAVTISLLTADTYNLEVTVLSSKKTYHFDRRKLAGASGDPIGGFCLFDRNGETFDVFFNGFQVLQKP